MKYYITHEQLKKIANYEPETGKLPFIHLAREIQEQKIESSERKERITKGIIISLVKMANKINEKNENSVHLQNELDLTKNQYNNFQKLRYHGLVAKVKENGVHKTGYWLITRKGWEFLTGGSTSIYVIVEDNRTIDHSDKKITLNKVLSSVNYKFYPSIEDYSHNGIFNK